MDSIETLVKQRCFSAFKGAWDAACGLGDLPARKDISLRRFAKFIPDMIILEKIGPRDYRYRQAGEEVKERLRMKEASINFFEFIDPEIQDVSEDWWGCLLAKPCGGMISYSIEYPSGILRHVATMLLPVTQNGGALSHLVGITKVQKEAYLEAPSGKTIVGEHWVEGLHFDIGFGVPSGDGNNYTPVQSNGFINFFG